MANFWLSIIQNQNSNNMAATPSAMIPLGTKAPDFTLLDTVSDKKLSLDDIRGKEGTLIMFICNHCPYVKHYNEELVNLASEYQAKGVQFVAISSNDVINYPDDSPEKMKETAKDVGYDFPYLYDETQEVAKAYQAECTPDFYLFDKDLKCVYRGQLDDSTPKNGKEITGKDMREALEKMLAGEPISEQQQPSIGCNIKWRQ